MEHLEAILAFARTKPVDERYDYGDWENCPLAQYCQSVGLDYGNLPFAYEALASGKHNHPDEWTWGDMVKRCEAKLASL